MSDDVYRDRVAMAAQIEIERRGHFAVVVPASGPAKIIASFGPEGPQSIGPGSRAAEAAPPPTRPDDSAPPARAARPATSDRAGKGGAEFYVPRAEAIAALRDLRVYLEAVLQRGGYVAEGPTDDPS